MPQDFLDELADVKAQVAGVAEMEHSSLGEFIRHEWAARADSLLAGVVLSAALPRADSPTQRAARIHLATAMVLLDVALALHKLLLLHRSDADTLGKSLVGGTVLAGDYCFSQAAVAAARTGNPRVVAIFSELLKELSEAYLRRLFEDGQATLNEFPVLFQSGGLAGAVLAQLAETEQRDTAHFAASLAAHCGPGTGVEQNHLPALGSALAGRVADHQQPRWRAILGMAASS